MATNANVIGLLRVLLSASTAEYETAMKRSATTTEASVRNIASAFKSLSGTDLLRSANATIAAIQQLGGVSKLTAAEQEKVHAQVSRALEKYQALGREAPQALKDIEAATRSVEKPTSLLSKVTSDFATTFKATLAGMVSAQAIIGGVKAAWGAMTEFVSSSVQAYAEQEAAVKKMTTALIAQGRATPQTIDQFKRMASEFQRTTVFSDELINEMQALLVQVGSVMPAEMEGALQAATNLASGLGIDLRQATMLVGKAFEGETGTLKRYGIVIDETKLKTQGVTAVLEAIHAKFGGQAQAQAETYAGKVQQIANAWGEVKEAVGEAVVANPLVEAFLRNMQDRLSGADAAAKDLDHSWSNFLKSFTLFPEASGFIAFVHDMEEAAKAANEAARMRIPPLIGGSELMGRIERDLGAKAAADAREETRKLEEAQKKAKEAADQWAKSVRALREELSGVKLTRELQLLAAATAGLTVEQLRQPDVMERVAARIRQLRLEGAELTPELLRVEAIVRRFTVSVDDFFRMADRNRGAFLGFFNDTFLRPQVFLPLDGLGDRIAGFFDKVVTRNDDFGKFVTNFKTLNDLAIGIEGAPGFEGFFTDKFLKSRNDSVRDLSTMLELVDGLTQSFQRLGSVVPGALGEIISGAADITSGIGDTIAAMRVLDDVTATTSQRMVANLQSVVGIATTVMGISRAIVGYLESRDPAGSGRVRESMTPRDFRDFNLNARLAGLDSNDLFATQNRNFPQAFARFNQLIAESQRMMAAYNLTWRDFSSLTQEFVTATSSDLINDFRALTARGVDSTRAVQGMGGALSQLVVDAVRTGTRIPGALQPILEQLIRMGGLTDEAARALLGLEAESVPAFADIEAAARRYGIELDTLGPKIEQIRINEVVAQIVKDFQFLTEAGADVGAVMGGMSDEVQDLVTKALRLGLTLPESLRPLLEQMLAAGLLADEFGVKLEDLDRIQFAKPLALAIDELILKLGELIDVLIRVGDEAVRQGQRARDGLAVTGHAIPRPGSGGPTAPPPGGDLPDPGLQPSASLGAVDFGGGSATWINSRGAIERPESAGTFAQASTLQHTAPSGGGNQVVINIHTIDQQGVQQFLERSDVQETLGREMLLNPRGLGSIVRETVAQGT